MTRKPARPSPSSRTPRRPSSGAPARAARAPRESGSTAVDAFLAESAHPLKAELELVRRIVVAASPTIREEVKWNAPSFRTHESFATLNGPRHVEHVMIVLHAGAKAKGLDLRALVADPHGMLDWRGKDRALVTLHGVAEIRKRRAALQALVRAWIRHV